MDKEEFSLLVTEIFYICMRINTETKFACFFEYPGHVGWITISIARSKEAYYDKLPVATEFYVSPNGSRTFQEILEKTNKKELEKKRDILKDFLVNHSFNYDNLIREQITEYIYSF